MFRSLLVLVAAFTATSSFAGSAVIGRFNLPSSADRDVNISVTFDANTDRPEQGLAWIDLNVEERSYGRRDEDGPRNVLHRTFQLPSSLPPLVYNAANHTVELTLPGHEPLVCAHVSTGLFGDTHVETAGICHLQAREVSRDVVTPVTGAVRTVRAVEVTLVTPYLM